jgi:TolA-binding protein
MRFDDTCYFVLYRANDLEYLGIMHELYNTNFYPIKRIVVETLMGEVQMKHYALAGLLLLMAFNANAVIYVCKDASNHKTYQDEPCTTHTIGQLEHVPDAPIEDQERVQQSIRSANENYIKRMQMQKAEQLEAQELERQRLALEVERRKLQQLEQQEQGVGQPVVIVNRWPRRLDRYDRRYGPNDNPYRSFRRYDGNRNQTGRSGFSIEYQSR